MLADADALVYLGLGLSAPAVARAVTARGWDGPCAMNTAGLRGYSGTAGFIDAGVRRHAFRPQYDARRVAPASPCSAGQIVLLPPGYDIGRLVAEGLARAPERTRKGIKQGLEQVKWLPAAEGHEGTLLGFGNYDRGALHGRCTSCCAGGLKGESIEVDSR